MLYYFVVLGFKFTFPHNARIVYCCCTWVMYRLVVDLLVHFGRLMTYGPQCFKGNEILPTVEFEGSIFVER